MKFSDANALAAVARASLVALAVAACAPGDTTVDGYPSWDSDGDGISNAVETWPANAEYALDPYLPDSDPSAATGTPGNGSLLGGLNYPDNDLGTYTFQPSSDPRWDRPDSNDWGVLHNLISSIEFVGRERDFVASDHPICYSNSWGASWYPAERFGIGDISKRGGGEWRRTYGNFGLRHNGHQNGTEVDMRYLRKDKGEIPLDLRLEPQRYDTVGTMDLFECLVATQHVVQIRVDMTSLGFADTTGGTILVHDSTHHDHFHVRFSP